MMNEKKIEIIRRLRENGYSYREIAKEVKTSRQTVWNVCKKFNIVIIHKKIKEYKNCCVECGGRTSKDHLKLYKSLLYCKECRPKHVWALYYDCCVGCGTMTKKHHSNGRCYVCYARLWRKLKKQIISNNIK